jgi:hypothetical protein
VVELWARSGKCADEDATFVGDESRSRERFASRGHTDVLYWWLLGQQRSLEGQQKQPVDFGLKRMLRLRRPRRPCKE